MSIMEDILKLIGLGEKSEKKEPKSNEPREPQNFEEIVKRIVLMPAAERNFILQRAGRYTPELFQNVKHCLDNSFGTR